MKLRRCNLYTCVCLSFIQSFRSPCNHYLDLFKLVHLGTPLPDLLLPGLLLPLPPPTCTKMVYLDIAIQQKTGWKACGWLLTERPSCWNMLVMLYYLSESLSRLIILLVKLSRFKHLHKNVDFLVNQSALSNNICKPDITLLVRRTYF